MNRIATSRTARSRRRRRLAVSLLLVLGGIFGCEGATDVEAPPSGQAALRSATAEPAEPDRLARLEARLEETEARLMRAETRAAAAEARARDAIMQVGVAPGGGPALGGPAGGQPMIGDPTVEHRTEAEIKASAVGVQVAAAEPAPPPEAYDERLDLPKAEAFNVDPREDD